MHVMLLRSILVGLLAAGLFGCAGPTLREVKMESFGTVDGQDVPLYTLENRNGLVAKITPYGAIITELHVPDRTGQTADVVLGFDKLDGYVKDHPYFGALVGRVANRIAKGHFTLEGKTYTLAVNNVPNHLHGGWKGFDKVVWEARPVTREDGPALELTHVSRDGEEGYPGTLTARVVYTLTQQDELRVEITAETDQPTPVNLTNHSYWNLAGHDRGDILGQVLQLHADRYTPTDETLIPTGKIESVAGTPFDFRMPKPIGRDIGQLPAHPEREDPGGYDVNYVVNGPAGRLRPAARVCEPSSGRVMEVLTTQPGIQFYSGNFLDGSNVGKGGAVYRSRNGFCLETQHFPDSVNRPGWPSVILRPGQTYAHTTVYRFRTE
jgi:aldose 1-epimerase